MQTETRLQAVGQAFGRWMRGDEDLARLPARMFWAGLAVRLLYMTVAHTYRLRVLGDHFQFGWEMGRIARALATGYGFADPFNGHSGPTAWTPPLYPLLLAGVFKVFGVYTLKSAWVILAINSVFSAATAPLVYELGWRCFGRDARGRSVALWSGWLWAFYPAAMQYAVHWVWDMALTTFLFAWVLVLALRMRGTGEIAGGRPITGLRGWSLFGLLWGLIALSNSSLLSFLPFCALWMVLPLLRRNLVAALRAVVVSAVCFGLVVSPWIVRNAYTMHAFIPLRSNFGAEFYESLRPSNHAFPWGAALPVSEQDPIQQRYRRMGELAYCKQQGERAKAVLRAHPRRFLGYSALRFYFFWVSVPHPVDRSITVEVAREFNYAFLSLAGVLGLALALVRGVPGAWLFFWAFAVIPILYYLITVQARFRHPLEPVITVLAVYLFQSAERPGRWRNLREVAA